MDNEEIKSKNQVAKVKKDEENTYEIDLTIDYTVTKELVEVVKNYPGYIKPDSIEEAQIVYSSPMFKERLFSLVKKILQTKVLSLLIKIKLTLNILFNLTAILLYLILDIDMLIEMLLLVNIIIISLVLISGIIWFISNLIVRETEGVSFRILEKEILTEKIIKSFKVIFKLLKIFGLMGTGKGVTSALLLVNYTEQYREDMLVEHEGLRKKISSLINLIELHRLLNQYENTVIFFAGSDITLKNILKKFLRNNIDLFFKLSFFNFSKEEKIKEVDKIINDWEQQSKNEFYKASYILTYNNKRQHLLEYLLIYIKKYIRHYYGINYSLTNIPFHEIKDHEREVIVPSRLMPLDTKAIKKPPTFWVEDKKTGFKTEYEKNLIYTVPEKTVVLEDEVDILQNNLDSEQFAYNQAVGIFDYPKMQRQINGEDYIHISIGQTATRESKGLRELIPGFLHPSNVEVIHAFEWKITKIKRKIEKLENQIFEDLERVKNINLLNLLVQNDIGTVINYRKKTLDKLEKIHQLENQIGLYQRKNRVKILWVLSTCGATTAKKYPLKNIYNGKYDRDSPFSFEAVGPVTKIFERYNSYFMKDILNHILDNAKVNSFSNLVWNYHNLNMDRTHVIWMNYPIYYKYFNVTNEEKYAEPRYMKGQTKAIPLENEKKGQSK